MFGRTRSINNVDFEAIESMARVFLDGFDNYDIYIMDRNSKTYDYLRKTGGSPIVGGVYINGVVEDVIGVYYVSKFKDSNYEDSNEFLKIEPVLFIIDNEPYYVSAIDIIDSIPVVSSIPIYDRFVFFGEFVRKVKIFNAGGDIVAREQSAFGVGGLGEVVIRVLQ